MLGGTTIKTCQLKVWYLNYFSTSEVNMGIRRSKNHQGIQICWFDPLLFNQNWINFEKPSKKCWFLCTFMVFQEFFNPGWKVADQTQKFEFLEVFRFFWHQCCQQEWRNSGWKESWAKIPVWICLFDNVGYFSHSILVTELNFVLRICKFLFLGIPVKFRNTLWNFKKLT